MYVSNLWRSLLRLVVYANLWSFWMKIAEWLIQMMCRAELEAALKSDIKTDPKLSQEQLPQPSSFAIALANSLPFIGMGAVDNAIMVRIDTSASKSVIICTDLVLGSSYHLFLNESVLCLIHTLFVWLGDPSWGNTQHHAVYIVHLPSWGIDWWDIMHTLVQSRGLILLLHTLPWFLTLEGAVPRISNTTGRLQWQRSQKCVLFNSWSWADASSIEYCVQNTQQASDNELINWSMMGINCLSQPGAWQTLDSVTMRTHIITH